MKMCFVRCARIGYACGGRDVEDAVPYDAERGAEVRFRREAQAGRRGDCKIARESSAQKFCGCVVGALIWARSLRETVGFEPPCSARASFVGLRRHRAFSAPTASPGRNMTGSKLLRTAKREIFAQDKAEKAGILCGFPLLITQYCTKRSALRLPHP